MDETIFTRALKAFEAYEKAYIEQERLWAEYEKLDAQVPPELKDIQDQKEHEIWVRLGRVEE